MPEIKGKASEVKLFKKNAFKGNDSYNVTLEGDERKFSYLCQGEPKIKVGEEQEFLIEEKTSGSNSWWTIKVKKNTDTFIPGGKFNKPDHIYALEWARRMFNSSFNTEKPWVVAQVTSIADWLLGQIKNGIDKDAIETAVTIQCASAMNKNPIDTKALSQHIAIFQDWINKNK